MAPPLPHATLRDLIPEDSDRLFAWRNSEAVRPYMYTDHLIGRDEHERWFAALPGDARRRYWVIELDGQPVGLANLYDIDRANHRCAWAYYLAEPSTRGLGLGSYVEFWVIEQVFGPMGLTKLWCEVLAANEAVWVLHERHGFVREACFRRHSWRADAPQDVYGLGLLAEDWPARRGAMAARLRDKGFSLTD
jgi:UDP-4-amino-4,6-dideoxy-N-acetyl-beta-L-altrosamine N-acetyltransferase